MNIVYQSEDGNNMIVEAQFLLKFLLKAKKIGHKLYSFVRQSDFINNVRNQLYNIDANYNKYKIKIRKFAENNDSANLTKELFWRPNVLLSILYHSNYYYFPIFWFVCQQMQKENDKFCMLFLNFMFHYNHSILNDTNDEFLKKYFNFNKCDGCMIQGAEFWAIDGSLIKSQNSIKYSIIELILKQPFFNGLSQGDIDSVSVLTSCIDSSSVEYLSLLFKYFDKNKSAFVKGIKWGQECWGKDLLIHLLDSDHIKNKVKLLELYLKICKKCDVSIPTKVIDEAIGLCSNVKNGDVGVDMIKQFQQEQNEKM